MFIIVWESENVYPFSGNILKPFLFLMIIYFKCLMEPEEKIVSRNLNVPEGYELEKKVVVGYDRTRPPVPEGGYNRTRPKPPTGGYNRSRPRPPLQVDITVKEPNLHHEAIIVQSHLPLVSIHL
jgi:hypothetical protein